MKLKKIDEKGVTLKKNINPVTTGFKIQNPEIVKFINVCAFDETLQPILLTFVEFDKFELFV